MLTGFFKNQTEQDTECSVVRFSDRIWLDEKGNKQVLRQFMVEVAKGELSRVCMVISESEPCGLMNYGNMILKKDFTFEHSDTAGPFNIVKRADAQKTGDAAIIDIGGFHNVLIFPNVEPRVINIGKVHSVILSTGRPIVAGEVVAFALAFELPRLIDETGKHTTLDYFDQIGHEESEILDQSHGEIPVIPTFGPDENYKGGFDIWLYLAPNFKVVDTSQKPVITEIDPREIDGEEGENRLKLGWKLRFLMTDDTAFHSGLRVLLDVRHERAEESFDYRYERDAKVIKYLAIAALIVSVIAVIVSLIAIYT